MAKGKSVFNLYIRPERHTHSVLMRSAEYKCNPYLVCQRALFKLSEGLKKHSSSSFCFHVSFCPSVCDRCCCQCSVPDHVDCVSQETAQTLQTAAQTHHGVPVKSQRRSRSQVGDHSGTVLLRNYMKCSVTV